MAATAPEGIRGRQMVFHLAGERYRTSKEAVQDKREKADETRERKRQRRPMVDENGAGPSNTTSLDDVKMRTMPEETTSGLMRVIGADDGDDKGQSLQRTDLLALEEKWGSRLRIRCTDEEIYFRLVGSHQKVGSHTRPAEH